jgi:hypothetical protein
MTEEYLAGRGGAQSLPTSRSAVPSHDRESPRRSAGSRPRPRLRDRRDDRRQRRQLCSLTSRFVAAAQIACLPLPLGKPPKHIEQPRRPSQIAGPAFDALCDGNGRLGQAGPTVRIHANTYLVGTCGISSILITGSQGHILIDGGTENGADLILANIRALGFDPGT